MLCAILYPENSDKARFYNLNNFVEDYYVLKNVEYQSTMTAVQSILLNYQPNYNSNINYQSNRVRNHLMFVQHGKTGDEEDDRKYKEQRPRRKLDHITCNNCGEKGHYTGNSECSTHTNIKEYGESSRKMKQGKYFNNPPLGEYQK